MLYHILYCDHMHSRYRMIEFIRFRLGSTHQEIQASTGSSVLSVIDHNAPAFYIHRNLLFLNYSSQRPIAYVCYSTQQQARYVLTASGLGSAFVIALLCTISGYNETEQCLLTYSDPATGTIFSTIFIFIHYNLCMRHINFLIFDTYTCKRVVNWNWAAFWTENIGSYHKVERNILLTHTNNKLLFTPEKAQTKAL